MNLLRLEAQEGNDGGREGYHIKDLVWQSYDAVVILQQLLFKYNNDLLAISHQSFMTGKKSTAQKNPDSYSVVSSLWQEKMILLFYEESQEIKFGTCNVLCMHLVWYIGVNLYWGALY